MARFDYTSRDYDTIRTDLLTRAGWRIPSWTTRDGSDFGMVMVELWAYMGDVLHYYVDRAAGEAFLQTATQRESVLAIANLLDYKPNERTAAKATVRLTLAPNAGAAVTLPAGTVFIAPSQLGFEQVFFTLDTDAYLEPGQAFVVNLTEGKLFNETLATSSPGVMDMVFTLPSQGIVPDSVRIFVAEGPPETVGGPATEVEYIRVFSLLQATYDAPVFQAGTGADDTVVVQFGNGVNGKIPAVRARIRVEYRTSLGQRGNIGPGRITALGQPVRFLSLDAASAGFGGNNAESIDSMKTNMPRAFRANGRVVTTADARDLALSYPWVSKAHAVRAGAPTGSDLATITLYATPAIANYTTTPQPLQFGLDLEDMGIEGLYLSEMVYNAEGTLRPRLERDLEERSVIGIGIDLALTVQFSYVMISIDQLNVKAGYIQYDVRRQVIAALVNLFDFDRVSYGQTIRLGDIYRAILAVPGVDYVVLNGTALRESEGVIPPYTLTDKTPSVGRLPRIDTTSIVFDTDALTGGITGSN